LTSERGADDVLVVGDVGGTNVRFAIARREAGGGIVLESVESFPDDDFAGFEDALAAYLERVAARPKRAAFAFAGPITDNAVTLTNRASWHVDGDALGARFGFERVLLVNDFAAAARGVAEAPEEAFSTIKDGVAVPAAPIVVAGPGTGFGFATLLPANGGWRVVSGEGGHQTYAPETKLEWALCEALRPMFSHISVEIIVAGKHAETVREALCGVLGAPYEPLEPPEVFARAKAGDEACATYCAVRAAATMSALSDAVLLVWARGGGVLTGGVAEHLIDVLRAPAAIERFLAHGPMTDFLSGVPVRLISAERNALVGAALLAMG
jgi:glucokinase